MCSRQDSGLDTLDLWKPKLELFYFFKQHLKDQSQWKHKSLWKLAAPGHGPWRMAAFLRWREENKSHLSVGSLPSQKGTNSTIHYPKSKQSLCGALQYQQAWKPLSGRVKRSERFSEIRKAQLIAKRKDRQKQKQNANSNGQKVASMEQHFQCI